MAREIKTHRIICNVNGCVFYREERTKKAANRAATSHLQQARHDVAIVPWEEKKQ